MNPLLVVAGNLIVDNVVHEDGSTALGQPGGAALYAALGASLWGVRVGIATVVGSDYPADVLKALDDRGIDLAGVRRVPGPSMKTWLLYEGRRRQVVHQLDSPSHAQMSPAWADLPAEWRPDACHLAPMPLPVQSDWLNELAARPGILTSLDPFELVEEASLVSLLGLFGRADLVLLSEDELLLEAALETPESCLARLAAPHDETSDRPRHIFLKRGPRGGMAYDCSLRAIRHWQPHAAEVVETTGAGDAFAGGLLAGFLQDRPLEVALERALVSASFALETRGAEGLLRATSAECEVRAQEWFGGDG